MQIPYKTTLIWSSALLCLLLAGCSFVWPGSDASSAHFWSTSAATGSPPNAARDFGVGMLGMGMGMGMRMRMGLSLGMGRDGDGDGERWKDWRLLRMRRAICKGWQAVSLLRCCFVVTGIANCELGLPYLVEDYCLAPYSGPIVPLAAIPCPLGVVGCC